MIKSIINFNNVVACNNKNLTQNPQLNTLKDKIIINDLKAKQTKIDLSTITKLSGLKIIANSIKTYKELINKYQWLSN